MSKGSQTYSLYPRVYDHIDSVMRKMGPKPLKKLGPGDRIGHYLTKIDQEASKSLLFPSMAEEYLWERTSGPIILPEDQRLLHNLYRAQFDLDSAAHLKFPYGSFMLAVPMGTEIGGFSVPPALVTWHQGDEISSDIYEPFGEHLGMSMGRGTPRLKEGQSPSDPILSILFQHPEHKNGRSRISIHSGDMPAVLAADDAGSIIDIIGQFENSQYGSLLKSDRVELNQQAILLRIVVALAVYHTATFADGTIEPGLPDPASRFNIKKPRFSHPLSLRNVSRKSDKNRAEIGYEISQHDRTWHFRQLRHERYYRGDYENWDVGSRIVFVSDATVTRKKKIYDNDEFMFDEAENQLTLNGDQHGGSSGKG